MHIYSSLGLTQHLSAQAGSPIKKAQNQNLAETINKPNNKVNTNAASFKDTLTLSKQTLGFKEIANKYDLTNVSFKELLKMVDELSAANLISHEESFYLTSSAIASQIKGFKVPENSGEFEMIMRDESEKINFTQFMNERLEYMLSKNKPNYQQIESMEKAIAVLDKLTALRGQSYA